MSQDAASLVKACLQAYVDKNRAAIEALIADDFHFTSPLDNALDRATYFERCWPNSEWMVSVDVIHQALNGNRAFIVYESTTSTGKRLRNCELHTARDGQLISAEVYFGWNLPHPAARGDFIENGGEGHA
jgi:ketosteroid isomerase-like protein